MPTIAGSSSSHLSTVATRAKSGFETAIALASTYKSFKLQALDASGRVIGTSQTFAP